MQPILFGGTFDPIHKGHLALVLLAQKAFSDASLIVIPVFRPVYKETSTAYTHRLAMCELAMRSIPAVHVSKIEQRPGHDGFYATTLRWLLQNHEGWKPLLLVGPDSFLSVTHWHDSDYILQHATLLTVKPAKLNRSFDAQCRFLHRKGADPVILSGDLPSCSASDVRRSLLKTGTSAWIPAEILHYIRINALYGVDSSGTTQ